ncbi:uncharacterized protein LOC128733061 isoform X1 [Sabethes cyaneus]|uniref:uncharacterized protein LOC128733061 isoform X1 n=1 Tax=Sabethes cyaneus TaxID=53552 RepID=UPI00237EBB8F|nr:uncharacterized protein LOC128733061 isoform X1 [Sabethes cyaneus]
MNDKKFESLSHEVNIIGTEKTVIIEKKCSIKSGTWSFGKSSQQLWSFTGKSSMSTMQRNYNSLHKRLSSSHNSLSDSTSKKVDDSMFITQAMSHDALDDNKIPDFYNVPLDSDIYSTPIDFINPYKAESTLQKKISKPGPFQNTEFMINEGQISSTKDFESKKRVSSKHTQTYTLDCDHRRTRFKISNKREDCNKNNFSINLKQKICNIFRISKRQQYLRSKKTILDGHVKQNGSAKSKSINDYYKKNSVSTRKLPPLPMTVDKSLTNGVSLNGIIQTIMPLRHDRDSHVMEFTASIDKVKECGWYWGPISSEGAEKILSNEPDGSFLVRDSSDDHYIFSLTFKLNGSVRHVRIDQDQGAFSFGSCAKFKSRTIMEFIENAVEHSRSGRYLFFLHRRPEHGPMRVQLINPVSRFKHVQSLQHLCRFVIHRTIIRKDLIQTLPLPRRVLDYLNYKNCLSERIEMDMISKS